MRASLHSCGSATRQRRFAARSSEASALHAAWQSDDAKSTAFALLSNSSLAAPTDSGKSPLALAPGVVVDLLLLASPAHAATVPPSARPMTATKASFREADIATSLTHPLAFPYTPFPMTHPISAGADLAKVYGEGNRCPICGAFAETVPHQELRWVCGVCGAPRVDLHNAPNEKLPEESAVAMREAAGAQRAAAVQRLTTWATGIPAAFTLLRAIALAPASFLASGVLVGMGVLFAILSARASRRGETERKRLRGAVERAWEAAIASLADKNKTAPEIGAMLRIAEADVETALVTRGVQVRVAPETRVAAEEPTQEEATQQAEQEKRV
jgi:hypothetical protein